MEKTPQPVAALPVYPAMRCVIFGLLLCLTVSSPLLAGTPAAQPSARSSLFEDGTTDRWNGFLRHRFTIDGHAAWVVEPSSPSPGMPWTWCTEFPDAFTPRTGVLETLKKGVWHAHISDFNRLGCPKQLALMDAFYRRLREKGFSQKVALVGLSRGGFMAYRWAARNPGVVACIYADAPVCDLKSWPGGFGSGKGSPSDWAHAKKLYGWPDDAAAKSFDENALDPKPLARLAAARIPLLHVVGDADEVVPVAENTELLAERYRKLGGEIVVISHKAGHHPHGLDDAAPIVDFLLKHTRRN